MAEMLRGALEADQLRLLQVIFGPFDNTGEWPVWQYSDITLDQKFRVDAANVLESLPVAGARFSGPGSYGLTWRDDSRRAPQPDSRVALTVAGLRHLRPATEPLLGAFLVTLRHLIDVQRKMIPSPREVVEAEVSGEAIREALLTASIKGTSGPPTEPMMRKLRLLLSHEPFLYNVVRPPRADAEEWAVTSGAAVIRAARHTVRGGLPGRGVAQPHRAPPVREPESSQRGEADAAV